MWEKDQRLPSTTSLTSIPYLIGFSTEDAISTLPEENNVSTSIGAQKIDIEYDAGKIL